ncbi:hypothetical protein AAVH_13463 [Aphelenchoides avenae]|nr:hypothetical protein AAVH_13463 [Aphelenchus avenae]
MREKISNERLLDMVREKTSWNDLHYADIEVQQARWRFIGHVLRRPEGRLTRRAMFSLPPWSAPAGRPKTNWKGLALKDLRSSCCAEVTAIVKKCKRWEPKAEDLLKNFTDRSDWKALC